MTETFTGKWKWLERTNMMIAVATAITTVITVVTGYISFDFGQKAQAQSLDRYIEGMIERVPASERDRLAPVIDVIKQVVNNAVEGRTGALTLSRSVEELTTAVSSVPTSRYSTKNAPTFSIVKGATALFCDDKHFINYRGPRSNSPGYYDIFVNGRGWAGVPGDLGRFQDGITVALMEARDGSAVFNVRCK